MIDKVKANSIFMNREHIILQGRGKPVLNSFLTYPFTPDSKTHLLVTQDIAVLLTSKVCRETQVSIHGRISAVLTRTVNSQVNRFDFGLFYTKVTLGYDAFISK